MGFYTSHGNMHDKQITDKHLYDPQLKKKKGLWPLDWEWPCLNLQSLLVMLIYEHIKTIIDRVEQKWIYYKGDNGYLKIDIAWIK